LNHFAVESAAIMTDAWKPPGGGAKRTNEDGAEADVDGEVATALTGS
jgi:hypothetical protein